MKKYLGIFALMMAMLLRTSMTCGALAEDWKWDQRVEIMVPAGGRAVDWIQRFLQVCNLSGKGTGHDDHYPQQKRYCRRNRLYMELQFHQQRLFLSVHCTDCHYFCGARSVYGF